MCEQPRRLTRRAYRWRAFMPVAALLALPAEALAHASERGHVLLLPTGHYLAGGAAAVAASFAALALLPGDSVRRAAGWRVGLTGPPERDRTIASLLAFVFLMLLLAAGIWGSRDPLSNPLPLTVWTLVWVGLALVQGLVGDVWAWINPWYGPSRLVAKLFGNAARPLPERWGCWPAVILFAAFAWFELIYPAPDDPARLALAVAAYALLTLIAVALLGFEAWTSRGEFMSVFFGMLGRFAVVGRDPAKDGGRRLALAWPGARLESVEPLPPSGVAFLLLVLSSVSFDGLSKTFAWLGAIGVNPLEFPGRTAVMAVNTFGMALTFAGLAAVYMLAVALGQRLAGGRHGFAAAAGLLVWSIVPIALAYHFSHYLVVLLVNGQYALAALSDPFGLGWNLFGAADLHVHAAIAAGSDAAWLIWNLQAGAIVIGHVLAVLIAHGLAFRLYPVARAATLSQLPLTLLMIGYTVFGLWLLSTPTAG